MSTASASNLPAQVEEMQHTSSERSSVILLQKANCKDLGSLADAIEAKLLMQSALCPAGHTMIHKTVTGSWFSSKHCSCCSKEFLQGDSRFTCKQCDFHLCQSCLAEGEKRKALELEHVAMAEIGRCHQPRRSSKLSVGVVESTAVLAHEDHKDHKVAAEIQRTPATALPVQETKSGWCIRGVYEHQGLKMGLRQLNTRPEVLRETMTRKKSWLMKEQLMMDLAEGKVDLTLTHANDLNAAQGDVKNLSLRQLLGIAVKYDTRMQGAQGEFMMAVENALYEKLGHCATSTAHLSCVSEDVDDVRRLGREAVLLVAAAAAIPSSPMWSWWIMGGRTFFDTNNFSCVEAFPEAGVLEFSDYSKVERFAGRMIDWQVMLVSDEADLRTFAEHQRRKSTAAEVSLAAVTQCKAGLRKTSASETTFAEYQRRKSTAAEESLDVLAQCRAALRKTSECSSNHRRSRAGTEPPSPHRRRSRAGTEPERSHKVA
jgi:hypothetical protein